MPKSRSAPLSHLPPAPWIYINDPSGSYHCASQLASLIPKATHLGLQKTISESADFLTTIKQPSYRSTVVIISDNKSDIQETEKQISSNFLKEASIRNGCNFASVNLYTSDQSQKVDKWGANHLEVAIGASCSTHVYQWLFTVLTVPEQLYLIPDSQMQEIDPKSAFKDYAYSPIADSRKHPKSAQIQFVALILTKPEIGPNQRLQWQVVDKTGTANFYFQYRGTTSQYSWDWVLSLKPGDRKCLPRMPMVQVKERTVTTIAKAPFRFSAALIGGTGVVVNSIGSGLCKAGKKIKLGSRSEWIPEVDVTTDAKGRKVKVSPTLRDDKFARVVPIEPKTEIKVFNEKGERAWKDDDSVVSTTAGSVIDEKQIKDFV